MGHPDRTFPPEKEVHFVNWGRTALECVVDVEGLDGERVALPAFICQESLEPVFRRHDITPVFVDIRLPSLHLNVEAVHPLLDEVAAVLYDHAFGYPADLTGLRERCERSETVLIEDCARATGAGTGGVPVGTFGHHAIYSLHKTSPVSKGGALATTAPSEEIELASPSFDVRTALSVLPERVRGSLSAGYPLGVERRKLDPLTVLAFQWYRIRKRGGDRPEERRKVRALTDELEPMGFTVHPDHPTRTYPTVPVLVPEARDALLHYLSMRGVPVKVAWGHPWAKSVVGAEFASRFPNAAEAADRVLDIDVGSLDLAGTRDVAATIREFATEFGVGNTG